MDYLKNIRIEINNSEITDDMINLKVETAKIHIMNYCNILEIPKQLEYIVCDMAIKMLKSSYPDILFKAEIKSKSMGDTSISYNIPTRKDLTYEELTNQFADQLNSFRKFRW